jgi:hypothetical protein
MANGDANEHSAAFNKRPFFSIPREAYCVSILNCLLQNAAAQQRSGGQPPCEASHDHAVLMMLPPITYLPVHNHMQITHLSLNRLLCRTSQGAPQRQQSSVTTWRRHLSDMPLKPFT